MLAFISQETDQGWRIHPEQLLTQLLEQWPGVATTENQTNIGKYSHDWTLELPSGALTGRLSKTQARIVLDGPVDAIAQFTSWFEAHFSPPDNSLLIYDEEFSQVVRLRGQTPPAEIVSVLRNATR